MVSNVRIRELYVKAVDLTRNNLLTQPSKRVAFTSPLLELFGRTASHAMMFDSPLPAAQVAMRLLDSPFVVLWMDAEAAICSGHNLLRLPLDDDCWCLKAVERRAWLSRRRVSADWWCVTSATGLVKHMEQFWQNNTRSGAAADQQAALAWSFRQISNTTYRQVKAAICP